YARAGRRENGERRKERRDEEIRRQWSAVGPHARDAPLGAVAAERAERAPRRRELGFTCECPADGGDERLERRARRRVGRVVQLAPAGFVEDAFVATPRLHDEEPGVSAERARQVGSSCW